MECLISSIRPPQSSYLPCSSAFQALQSPGFQDAVHARFQVGSGPRLFVLIGQLATVISSVLVLGAQFRRKLDLCVIFSLHSYW